jgi:hypothetical protein
LAGLSRGVDLVRVLLDEGYETRLIGLDSDEQRLVFERVLYHRLHRQLALAIDTGRVGAESLGEVLDESAMSLSMRRLSLEGLAVDVAGALSGAGVESLVLKGIATGRLDYHDPTLRHTTDVDLLVRPGDFKQAVDLLAELGFTRRNELVLLDKGESWRSEAGVVDLHTRPHSAGRFLSERWWSSSEILSIAGHELRALPRGGRLAHAASHFSVSYPNHRILSSLLDIQVIARVASDTDRSVAEEFLAEVGVSDLTARITGRAAVLIGDADVKLGRLSDRPRDLMLRRAYDRSDLDLVSVKLAKTFGMPWREKPGAVRSLLAPTESFLAEGGYKSRTQRLVSLVGRGRRQK